MEKKTNNKKVWNVISSILTYMFIAIAIFAVVVTIMSKRSSDGTAEVLGYQLRLVLSDSMASSPLTDVSKYEIKSIPARSLVFVKVIPDDTVSQTLWYRSLKVGDVLTFKYVYTTQETITHRIIDIKEKDTGGFIITLEGDNKTGTTGQLQQVIDTSIPNNTNYVIGKVVGQSRVIGFILSLTREPIGLALLIIVPCVIIIIFELRKIFNALKKDKQISETETTKAVSQNDVKQEDLQAMLKKINAPSRGNSSEPTDEDIKAFLKKLYLQTVENEKKPDDIVPSVEQEQPIEEKETELENLTKQFRQTEQHAVQKEDTSNDFASNQVSQAVEIEKTEIEEDLTKQIEQTKQPTIEKEETSNSDNIDDILNDIRSILNEKKEKNN